MGEMFRPGRTERLRRLAARPQRHRATTQRDTLAWRRAAAALVFVLLASLAAIMTQSAIDSRAETAEWVLTQPHHSAELTYVRDRGKTQDYRASIKGVETAIDDGTVLDGLQVGDRIEYVTNPQDPGWIVAVGDPGDWDPDPLGDRIMAIVMAVLACVGSLLAAAKLVPEDLWRFQHLFGS